MDDRRVWLSSGTIHYFRTPSQLWRDRILKAKRAGLNCVETYVAWNFHEMQEGKWDFSGDKDVAGFVRLCGELGMYVILRPGPYICAEWDFGGLPAWLATKSGIAYRTNNATYIHYIDKYLRQVLPRLVDLQITRGGPIALIQSENEYIYTPMPDRQQYFEFLSQAIRRSGFDIPIITCNFMTEPKAPEAVECFNGYENLVGGLKKLRAFQPNAPMLTTEFWPGWFDWWGGQHNTRPARHAARKALEMLGCGAQVNYYMFHGGTNFAFWGSRLGAAESAYQTTSYDYDAPLAEGGGLTEKYYLTKLVNMLAKHMAPVLAQAKMQGVGITMQTGTEALNIFGPAGNFAVITNNGDDAIKTAVISLPDGRQLTVSLEVFGATAVPFGVQLAADRRLDYTNLMPLGIFGEGNLVLHAPAGFAGVISINSAEITHAVPAGDKVDSLELGEQRIYIINTDLARRAWEIDGSLILGPAYVGETIDDASTGGIEQYSILAPGGGLSNKKVKKAAKPAAPIKLGGFSRVAVCEEPMDVPLAWRKIDRPADLAALGVECGYGWYRAQIDSSAAGSHGLFLPDCEDRATIYLNGSLVGTWGRGAGAQRKPIKAAFRKGQNNLVVLADNLGRVNWGPMMGAPKGLSGQVYDAKPLAVPAFKITPGGEFSRRLLPRMLTHMAADLEKAPLFTAQTSFKMTKVQPVHLSFVDMPQTVAISVNGRQVIFNPGWGCPYGQITLANELVKGVNKISVLVWGLPADKDLDKCFALHVLDTNLTAGAAWQFKKWDMPHSGGRVVGKELPAWYSCKFKYAADDRPLFLHLGGSGKGQIYLNGRNVGRFWSIGPQEWYYLPEPWLAKENELLIFEESGNIPSGSKLEFRPGGPYHVPGVTL